MRGLPLLPVVSLVSCVAAGAAILSAVAPSGAAPPASAAMSVHAAVPARIDVEFLADGRCTVAATGHAFHSNLTYKPQKPSPTLELRCAIPPVPDAVSVELIVTLPAGMAPARGDEEPLLAWTQRGSRWIGTASLAAAPLLVRVPEAGGRTGRRARALRWVVVLACLVTAMAIVVMKSGRHG
jgi:hypothetical protein